MRKLPEKFPAYLRKVHLRKSDGWKSFGVILAFILLVAASAVPGAGLKLFSVLETSALALATVLGLALAFFAFISASSRRRRMKKVLC